MPDSLERCVCAAVLAIALGLGPARVQASPPESASEVEGPTEPARDQDPPAEPEPEPSDPPDVTVDEVEPEIPTGGGVVGAIVDPNDPNATRAQSDLEGEALDTELDDLPERMPPFQAAGWWTTFTAVALATTGGIFAGIAEVREDEAERLAYGFDLTTGASYLYGPVESEYEQLLREGTTYQWVARGFVIAGGATLIAGIALFAIDAKRRRASKRGDSARIQLDPGPAGVRLRF